MISSPSVRHHRGVRNSGRAEVKVSVDRMPAAFGPLTLIVLLLINVLFEPRASRPKPREPAVVTVP